MNQFERYDIPHLSPSTCNKFAASPAAFVLEKVLKRKSAVGAAAHRGTAVEAGVTKGLLEGAPVAECVREAEETFGRLTALSGDPRRDVERAALPDMVKIGLWELLPYGAPSSTQQKVEWRIDGVPVPMIGFFDFEWEQDGIVLDLKTTHRLPSKISTSHARQVALYCAARNLNSARICYATPKKAAVYALENVSSHVMALESIARAIASFLTISNDPLVLARMLAPDVDSFYFSDPETRQLAFEIWGV